LYGKLSWQKAGYQTLIKTTLSDQKKLKCENKRNYLREYLGELFLCEEKMENFGTKYADSFRKSYLENSKTAIRRSSK